MQSELERLAKDMKGAVLKYAHRTKLKKKACLVNGKLTVFTFGITTKQEDIQMYKDLYKSINFARNRVFGNAKQYNNNLVLKKRININRFLACCKGDKKLKYLGCVTAPSVDAKPVTAQQIIEAADKSRERSANRERKTRVIRRIE